MLSERYTNCNAFGNQRFCQRYDTNNYDTSRLPIWLGSKWKSIQPIIWTMLSTVYVGNINYINYPLSIGFRLEISKIVNWYLRRNKHNLSHFKVDWWSGADREEKDIFEYNFGWYRRLTEVDSRFTLGKFPKTSRPRLKALCHLLSKCLSRLLK